MVDYLAERAKYLHLIRNYFADQNVLEVFTDSLLSYPVSDPFIDSASVILNKNISKEQKFFLHTSPEIEMKKLLKEGSGDIYQICKVFRDNEFGERNFNEFLMLEYYRVNFDMNQLMDDLENLLKSIGFSKKITRYSYQEIFSKYTDIDIYHSNLAELQKLCEANGLSSEKMDLADLQIMLFVHLIEGHLKDIPACYIYDFPKSQSALAKIDGNVAKRFELYLGGIEVANGYDELQNMKDYEIRFHDELSKRKSLDLTVNNFDQDFVSQGKDLMQCSGVAIGLDRLFEVLNLDK
jgi:lysyl-tRNA synthetase class 2